MEGGLVVSQGKLTSKRVGDKYAAIAVRHLTVGAIDKQFMADVVNDPANSGWVPLKIECPQHEGKVLRDLPTLRPPGVAGTPPARRASCRPCPCSQAAGATGRGAVPLPAAARRGHALRLDDSRTLDERAHERAAHARPLGSSFRRAAEPARREGS
jgi:hypothetical protein